MNQARMEDPGQGKQSRVQSRMLPLVCVFIVLAVLPLGMRSQFLLNMMILTLMWAGIAGAWNIAGGYCGVFSVGHAVFFATGAYTSAVLFVSLGITPWLGMWAGGLLASLIAIALILTTRKLTGLFFATVTAALTEICLVIALTMKVLRPMGEFLEIPFRPSFRNMIFSDNTVCYYIMLAYTLAILIITAVLERSRLGHQMMAVRENPVVAEAIGINTLGITCASIALSAFLTAIGGTLYAFYILYLVPNAVLSLHLSVQFLLLGVVGGLGTVLGPLVGSLVLIPVGELLRGYLGAILPGLHFLLYGVVLIVVLLFMPTGIVPRATDLILRLRRNQ